MAGACGLSAIQTMLGCAAFALCKTRDLAVEVNRAEHLNSVSERISESWRPHQSPLWSVATDVKSLRWLVTVGILNVLTFDGRTSMSPSFAVGAGAISRSVMWETLIVEKDSETLTRAKQFVCDERERMSKRLRIAEPSDLALAFEHRNLLDAAEAIIGSADMRRESRGSHYRRDYPERDDRNWLTNIFITRPNGSLSFRKEWVAQKTGWVDEPGDVRIKPWG